MLIVAKSTWERGYIYSAEILNREMYKWDSPEDRWRVYEIDQYNTAYETAQHQRFGFREHGKYLVEYTR